MRRYAAAATFLAVVSHSAPAFAVEWRWPWESSRRDRDDRDRHEDDRAPSPRDRDRIRDRHGRAPHAPARVAPWNHDIEFVARMLDATRAQIAMSERVLDRSGDPAVRAFAQRTLAEAGAFERTLLARARELGYPVSGDFPHAALPAHGWELDLAYLRTTLDVIAADRPYFADYKRSVGGGFHDALAVHWDEMVDRRDAAKRLHDRVRNEARRHGANV